MKDKIINWEQYKKAVLTTCNIITEENYDQIIKSLKDEFNELPSIISQNKGKLR